jgi:hypothetical protein
MYNWNRASEDPIGATGIVIFWHLIGYLASANRKQTKNLKANVDSPIVFTKNSQNDGVV